MYKLMAYFMAMRQTVAGLLYIKPHGSIKHKARNYY